MGQDISCCLKVKNTNICLTMMKLDFEVKPLAAPVVVVLRLFRPLLFVIKHQFSII